MKVLVTGGNGLLGSKVVDLAEKKKYEVIATSYPENPLSIKKRNVKFFQLDITSRKNTVDLVKKIQPNYIVHTAALTNVDACETDKELARKVNTEGTKTLAETAKEVGAGFAYISTDYVFDGERGNYKENDDTNPINWYGYTKLEGEKAVQEVGGDFVIARTSVLYGWNSLKQNFVTWVIDQLKSGKEIKIVKDQFNSPTLANDLAETILRLIETRPTGIFHTSGCERINRYDFAVKIADVFGLNKDLIKPVKSSALDWIAKRPMDSSLNTNKISRIRKPLNLFEGLKIMKEII